MFDSFHLHPLRVFFFFLSLARFILCATLLPLKLKSSTWTRDACKNIHLCMMMLNVKFAVISASSKGQNKYTCSRGKIGLSETYKEKTAAKKKSEKKTNSESNYYFFFIFVSVCEKKRESERECVYVLHCCMTASLRYWLACNLTMLDLLWFEKAFRRET